MSTVTIERAKLEQWVKAVVSVARYAPAGEGVFSAVMMAQDDMNEVLRQTLAAPVQEPASSNVQAKWLGNALFDCIKASGIIREDIGSLSVGELLFFSKDLKGMLERQAATRLAEPVAWRLNGESSLGHGKVFGEWKLGKPPKDVADLASVDKNWSLEFAYTTMPAAQPAPDTRHMPGWMKYDAATDVLIIHGRRYSAAMFGESGFLAQVGTLLRIEDGQPECVTLTTVQPAVPLTDWVSVDDRLPGSGGYYLVTVDTDEGPHVDVLLYSVKEKHWLHEGEPTFCHSYFFSPTHWAVRPEAARGIKKGGTA